MKQDDTVFSSQASEQVCVRELDETVFTSPAKAGTLIPQVAGVEKIYLFKSGNFFLSELSFHL